MKDLQKGALIADYDRRLGTPIRDTICKSNITWVNDSETWSVFVFLFVLLFVHICICIALHKVPTNLILRIYALEMIVHLARLSADPTVEFMPLNHQLIANLPLNNNPMNLFYDPSNIIIAFIFMLIVNLRTWDWTIVISVLVNMVLCSWWCWITGTTRINTSVKVITSWCRY